MWTWVAKAVVERVLRIVDHGAFVLLGPRRLTVPVALGTSVPLLFALSMLVDRTKTKDVDDEG